MVVYTADIIERSYAGPGNGGNTPNLVFNRIRCGSPNPNGVFFHAAYSGFKFATLPRTIDSDSVLPQEAELAALMAAHQFDAIVIQLIPARDLTGALTTNLLSDPAPVDINAWTAGQFPGIPHLGPAFPGNGIMTLKTASALPPGFSGSLHPAFDPTRPTPYSAMCQFVQHFYYGAMGAEYAGKMRAWFGGSAATDCALWPGYSDDLSGYHAPGGVGQDAVPTNDFFHAFISDPFQSDMTQFPPTFPLASLAKRVSVGGSPLYDEQCAHISDSAPGQLAARSVCHFGTATPELHARNKLRPMHLVVGDWNPTQTGPWELDHPTHNAGPHDAYHGILFYALFGDLGCVTIIAATAPDPVNAAALAAAGIHVQVVAPGLPTREHRSSWFGSEYNKYVVTHFPHGRLWHKYH